MSALLPLEQALARLLAQAAAEPILDREEMPAAAVDGRVLAAPLISGLDLPPWANSAMDGYALRLADWAGEPLAVSQQVFAGQAPAPLQPGTCARIFTGAPLPEGADSGEMQENAEVLSDGRVRFREPLRQGMNVRPQGQEIRAGEVLLETGTLLEARVGADLLVSIFSPYGPLHDGAVLISGDTVFAAGVILPLTQFPVTDRSLGTRHRAAIGISEETDALALVLSE